MSSSIRPTRFARTRRCRLEPLEDRRLLTAYLVNSLSDLVAADGYMTLREALEAANTNAAVFDAPAGSDSETDVIAFSPDLFTDGEDPVPGTIRLGGTHLTIADDLELQGPGDELLSINANQQSGVFYVDSGVTAAISGLQVTGGLVSYALAMGGGIYCVGTLTIEDCAVVGNSAGTGSTGYGVGGGICVAGTLTVINSVVSHNVATGHYGGFGGGIHGYDSSTIIVADSVVSDNAVMGPTAWGGGIRSIGKLTVTNSILAGNAASGNTVYGGVGGWGGGIYSDAGDLLTIRDSTIAGNYAKNFGGGIYVTGGAGTVTNAIVACNDALSDPNVYGSLSAGSGFNLIDADPGFLVNPGPGDDGVWGTEDDVSGDIYPRADSPAVDAGSNELAVDAEGEPLVTDVDGLPRILNGTVDKGASEYSVVHTLSDIYEDLASGESHVLDVAANDEYPVGATVTVEIVTGPERGAAVVNPDGTITYTSEPYPGSATFRYRLVVDGQPTNVATVRIGLVGPFVVSTAVDETDGNYTPGNLSLREALALAAAFPGPDVITFHASLTGEQITLSSGQLVIDSSVEIQGPGAEQLTIDANQQSRVFYVNNGVTSTISGLTITGGRGVSGGEGESNDDGYGGGVFNAGTLTIKCCFICGNSSSPQHFYGGSGGGIYSYYPTSPATLTIISSIITGNSAHGSSTSGGLGGGINSLGTMSIIDSQIVGNSAEYNGGGIISVGVLTVSNSTIAGNAAKTAGGGIYGSTGTRTVTNSIVALNAAASDPNVSGSLSAESGFNLIDADPGFVRDPSAGLDGVWGTADDDTGDLRLASGSAAINGGSNELALDAEGNPLAVDLDGKPRIVYGTVDIGAYEYALPGDASLDGAVDDADASVLGTHWLRSGMGWSDGDFNADGRVDDRDAAILAAHWGQAFAVEGAGLGETTGGGVAAGPAGRVVGPSLARLGAGLRRRIEPLSSRSSTAAQDPVEAACRELAEAHAFAQFQRRIGPAKETRLSRPLVDLLMAGYVAWG